MNVSSEPQSVVASVANGRILEPGTGSMILPRESLHGTAIVWVIMVLVIVL